MITNEELKELAEAATESVTKPVHDAANLIIDFIIDFAPSEEEAKLGLEALHNDMMRALQLHYAKPKGAAN